jgi:hypothetical protein
MNIPNYEKCESRNVQAGVRDPVVHFPGVPFSGVHLTFRAVGITVPASKLFADIWAQWFSMAYFSIGFTVYSVPPAPKWYQRWGGLYFFLENEQALVDWECSTFIYLMV